LAQLLAFHQNRLQHPVNITTNVPIAKADHTITLLIEPRRARLVVLDLSRVRIAIDLDYQPASSAIKVSDEPINGVLSSELEATQLSVAQARP
jgi:hypothetical protein